MRANNFTRFSFACPDFLFSFLSSSFFFFETKQVSRIADRVKGENQCLVIFHWCSEALIMMCCGIVTVFEGSIYFSIQQTFFLFLFFFSWQSRELLKTIWSSLSEFLPTQTQVPLEDKQSKCWWNNGFSSVQKIVKKEKQQFVMVRS